MMRKISVIIPALNEEQFIAPLLNQLESDPFIAEIIVVDGGSKDSTMQIVRKYPNVRLATYENGRAKQMNYGASLATCNILWFLHSDSEVPARSGAVIASEMANGIAAGSFYLGFTRPSKVLDIYSYFSRFNLTIFTYGDQGIFVKKDVFDEIGGYNDIPIMEDVDLVRSIKRHGKFVKLKLPVKTSSRRFEKYGLVWQELKNIILVTAFYIGVSPHFLSRFYRY